MVEKKLVVDIDTNPHLARGELLRFATRFQGLGVIIKVESALRKFGYGLIEVLHDVGFSVFADTKFASIRSTNRDDAIRIGEYRPEFVTIKADVEKEGMEGLYQGFLMQDPKVTNILAVTLLTSIDKRDCYAQKNMTPNAYVRSYTWRAMEVGVDGVVASAEEAAFLRKEFERTAFLRRELKKAQRRPIIATPGIRPEWTPDIPNDDQRRTATPAEAIKSGADLIIVGRPITLSDDPRGAAMRILEEMRLQNNT